MFANIKQNYEIIEKKLGCLSHKEFDRPPYYGLVEETLDSPDLNFKLRQSTLLREAAKGDVVAFSSRLADGVDVKSSKNFIADIEKTIGAMLDYKNTVFVPSDNLTPLHFATINGHFQVVAVLISKGADVNAADDSGLTPLHLASGGGYIDIVILLSIHGANVNAKDNNDVTPLHFAAELDLPNVLQFLVSEGACVNNKTKSFQYSKKLGESILSHRIEMWTPLDFTIKYKFLDAMKVLLPVEVSMKSDYINRLYDADRKTFMEAFKLLMSLDKNVITLGVDNYEKLFKLALDKKCPKAVKALVKKNMNVNLEYADGTTPLFRSILFGEICGPEFKWSLDIIKTLLTNGANVNVVDSNGYSPLEYSIMIKDLITLSKLPPDILPGAFIPNRMYAETLIELFLDNGCSKDIVCKCLGLLRKGKVVYQSLWQIVHYYLANYPGDKPEYLRSTRNVHIIALSNYWDKCVNEIEKMKRKRFSNGVLLYTLFLEKDFNTVALYIKNSDVIEYCESYVCNITYPYYYEFILKKLCQSKHNCEVSNK